MNTKPETDMTHNHFAAEPQSRHAPNGSRHKLAEREARLYSAEQHSTSSVPSIAEIIDQEWPQMEAAMRYLADR
jgi:hypothetical protein